MYSRVFVKIISAAKCKPQHSTYVILCHKRPSFVFLKRKENTSVKNNESIKKELSEYKNEQKHAQRHTNAQNEKRVMHKNKMST